MPQLICLVQRLTLADGERTLIREKEIFTVDDNLAEIYVKGGIAKPVEQPVKKPEPVKEVPRNEPMPAETPQAQKVKADQQSSKKKPGR